MLGNAGPTKTTEFTTKPVFLPLLTVLHKTVLERWRGPGAGGSTPQAQTRSCGAKGT